MAIPFIDSVISELETRFATDKRAHFELFVLIPEVITKKDNLEETVEILTSKWKHLMKSEDNFGSELSRWKHHCGGITTEKSVTRLLNEDADPIFFPNI